MASLFIFSCVTDSGWRVKRKPYENIHAHAEIYLFGDFFS